uniref:PDZ domain-containing protein n=1 Tax=Sander lucioperca TaxID=283035 RepID=A0A8C9XXJ5_SANLU
FWMLKTANMTQRTLFHFLFLKVEFTLTRPVEFPGDWGPLGIHVIPYCSSLSGRTLGLHIKGIEENSRSKRENIFQQDECIVKINGTPLHDKTFAESQEVFRRAMTTSSVRLEVLPQANKPRYEKSLIGQLFTSDEPQKDTKLNTKLEVRRPDTRAKTPEPAAVNPSPAELQRVHGSLETVSPTPPARAASSSPTPRPRSQSPLASKSPAPGMASLSSKKGGKKIKIDLKKGAEGLGFTVVTRDSSVHGPGPILVKNILPRGAAIKDGRLQPGDRVLEVNGVDMTGRSQEELVAMLRSTRQGESVCVVVARQEDIFLPRELKGEEVGSLVLEDGREQLMYEIPLNESGSAGLGVSLKGNKSRETGEDLGIFIKSIIHGGAAYKDGRLSVNDQMIAVNGESLLGRSNHAAMETLRRSMSYEGNARGTIQLVVLRAPRQVQLADESNMGSLAGQRNEPSADGALGPTLGLWKSSSLESLQTAVSEAKQSHSQAQVPFHRPRPHMVRGRGANQSFRLAIDKSYDGPSEDDMSEESSGPETPVSGSSRQDLDAEDGKTKKKKTKGKKKEKKSKGKKKTEDSEIWISFNTLTSIYNPRYAEIHSGHFTPDVEDDDSDPNYARINNFRQPPSPQSFISRTPSPAALSNPLQASSEELDGLYAKVNKSRPPPALQNHDQRLQGQRREYQQARAAPGYDELDAARRRVLENDPHRANIRYSHYFTIVHRQVYFSFRRDPYDYPTHSRPVPREPAPYSGHYHDPPASSQPGRVQLPQTGPQSHQAPSNPRYYPSSPHAGQQNRAALRQDVPPSPTAGRHTYEAVGGRGDGYRQHSPGRYTSPERYGDERQPDPRRKNPLIDAV